MPGYRYGGVGWRDPNSAGILMMGCGHGYDTSSTGYLNDFWTFNTSTKQWACAGGASVKNQLGVYSLAGSQWFSENDKPGARYLVDGVAVASEMYLFGGTGYSSTGTIGTLNDLWATRGPTVVIGPSPSPTTTPTATSSPTCSPTPTATPTPLGPVQWRWLSGSSITNAKSVCGTAGQFSASFTPGARTISTVTKATDSAGRYGGLGYSTGTYRHSLGDLWGHRQRQWSGIGEWGWLGGRSDSTASFVGQYSGSTPYPGTRTGAVAWHESGSGLVMVYAGYGLGGRSGDGFLSDLWSFNPTATGWQWTWLKGPSDNSYWISTPEYGVKGLWSSNTVPRGPSHSNAHNGLILLGDSVSGYLSTTMKYDSASNQWGWLSGPSTCNQQSVGGPSGYPGGRIGSAMIAAAGSSFVYIFGGKGYPSTSTVVNLADLWSYNTITNQWAYISGVSDNGDANAPSSFVAGSAGFYAGGFPGSRYFVKGWAGAIDTEIELAYVFGGQLDAATFQNDLWAFNTTTSEWAWIGGASTANQAGSYSDAKWFSSANMPGARYLPGASVNNLIGAAYLFGGGGASSTNYNDLWVLRGATVTISAASPTPTITPTVTASPSTSPTPSPSSPPTPTPTPLQAVGWWWLSGSSAANQLSVGGAAGVYSTAYHPSNRYSMATAASASAYHIPIHIFGGRGPSTTSTEGYLGDCWAYNQTTNEWCYLAGKSNTVYDDGKYSGSTPYPGGHQSSVMWLDMQVQNSKIYVMGGMTKDRFGSYNRDNELWTLDRNTLVWEWVKGSSVLSSAAVYGTKGTAHPDNTPGAFMSASLVDFQGTNPIIFGGYGNCAVAGDGSGAYGYRSDMWRYQPSVNAWAWIGGPSVLNQFGVGGASGMYNSAYIPGSRYGHVTLSGSTSTSTATIAYLYGGQGYSSANGAEKLADLWAYNVATSQWAYVSGNSVAVGSASLGQYGALGQYFGHPGARSSAVGWADPNSNANLVYVYGGQGYATTTTAGKLSDLWAFNTTSEAWAWAGGDSSLDQSPAYSVTDWYSAENNPGGRTGSSSAVDTASATAYIFGGLQVGGSSNEMWATNGAAVGFGASPTPTVTSTATITPSPTTSPTMSASPSMSPTSSPTSSPSVTATGVQTSTASPIAPTATPTAVPVVPTATATGVPISTATPIAPTATPTASPTGSPATNPNSGGGNTGGSPGSGNPLSPAAIAGSAGGGFVFVAAVLFAVWRWRRESGKSLWRKEDSAPDFDMGRVRI